MILKSHEILKEVINTLQKGKFVFHNFSLPADIYNRFPNQTKRF